MQLNDSMTEPQIILHRGPLQTQDIAEWFDPIYDIITNFKFSQINWSL